VNYKTGEIEKRIDYSNNIFAESITVFQDKIYQLTWQNNTTYIYDKNDFSLLKVFDYDREGWGITNDERHLIVSDGSATLFFLDPDTLGELYQIVVRDNNGAVPNLNDLAYVNGKVFANVFESDRIAIINPENGGVEHWLDLSGLRKRMGSENEAEVLNGIMYDSVNDRLFATGKYWSKLFEIKLVNLE